MISELLELVAKKGGAIVSSASLDVATIAKAQSDGTFYVDKNGCGYAWVPPDDLLSWAVNNKQC